MTNTQTNETTPGELMQQFRGRGLKSIIIFTVIVHAVLLIGPSLPFLWKKMLGTDSSKLSESERVELAVQEATSSLRRIAEEHGVKPQDLGSRFAGGAPNAPESPATPAPKSTPPPADAEAAKSPDSTEPPSAIQKEIEKVKTGPAVPEIGSEKEDLFK